MRCDDDPDRAIHPRQFFDDDGVFDVAKTRAAVIFREDRAQVAEPTQLFDNFQGKYLVLVPLHDMRRDFGLGELSDRLAKLDLLRRVVEFHV